MRRPNASRGLAGAIQSIRTHCRQGTGAPDSVKQSSVSAEMAVSQSIWERGRWVERKTVEEQAVGDRGESGRVDLSCEGHYLYFILIRLWTYDLDQFIFETRAKRHMMKSSESEPNNFTVAIFRLFSDILSQN